MTTLSHAFTCKLQLGAFAHPAVIRIKFMIEDSKKHGPVSKDLEAEGFIPQS